LLTAESLDAFRDLIQPPPYIQKLNKLRLDKRWIDLVANEENVYIEYEDWINKSLPRFHIRIGCDSSGDIEEESWPTIYGLSMEEAISYTIPWADFEMDYYAYEGGLSTLPGGIVPISENGEVERYRLILSLNELGQAFVILNEYLSEDDPIEGRAFTL